MAFERFSSTLLNMSLMASAVLVFEPGWETDTLRVGEDYYRKLSEDSTFIERETHTLPRLPDGTFQLKVAHRGEMEEQAVYFIESDTGKYVMRLRFGEESPFVLMEDVDLDHDGRPERIQFETVDPGQVYLLSVIREDGSLLWSRELGIPHAMWGTILLYEQEGKDYLISYDPRIYQGDGDYDCTLFSLEGGRENIIGSWSVDFDRVDFTKPMPISEEMRAFKDTVNPLLMESTLLATTEQLELLLGPVPARSVPRIYPVHFTPEDAAQTIAETVDQTKP